VIAGVLIPAPNPGGECSDFSPRPGKEEICEDDNCRRALSDARRIYNDLQTKRIPQYMYGVHHGLIAGSPGHHNAILQKQEALQDAINRVKLYCKTWPPELARWEQVASPQFPIRH
jgi:hypothetical protein